VAKLVKMVASLSASEVYVNWQVIFQLSLLGLAMAIGTVFGIPTRVEPFFWLAVLIFSAWVIAARAPGRYFFHGLVLGLLNCVWVTAAHMIFAEHYLAGHPREAGMLTTMPMPHSPRLMMLMMGPVIGIASGCIIGGVALLLAVMRRGRPQPTAQRPVS
jgi:hypothetical protein